MEGTRRQLLSVVLTGGLGAIAARPAAGHSLDAPTARDESSTDAFFGAATAATQTVAVGTQRTRETEFATIPQGWALGLDGEGTERWRWVGAPPGEPLDGGGADWVTAAVPRSDGFLLVGASFVGRVDGVRPWLLPVDEAGDPGSFRDSFTDLTGDSFHDSWADAARTPSGETLLAGRTGGDFPGDLDRGAGWLVALDAEGDVRFAKQYEETELSRAAPFREFTGVVTASCEAFVLVGTRTADDRTIGWLVSTDSDGCLELTREYAAGPTAVLTDGTPGPSGGYLLVGAAGDSRQPWNPPDSRLQPSTLGIPGVTGSRAWLLCVDEAGERQSETLAEDSSYVAAVTRGPENGFLVVGQREGHPWVARVDSDGSLGDGTTLDAPGVFSDIAPLADGGYLLTGWTDTGDDWDALAVPFDVP